MKITSKPFYALYCSCLIGLALVTLQACETLGYEGVDTSRKAIVVAIAEVRAQNLLVQDLIQRRAISRDQAQSALNTLTEALNYAQTALNAVDVSGDPLAAGTNLQKANTSLSIAIGLLAPFVEET